MVQWVYTGVLQWKRVSVYINNKSQVQNRVKGTIRRKIQIEKWRS